MGLFSPATPSLWIHWFWQGSSSECKLKSTLGAYRFDQWAEGIPPQQRSVGDRFRSLEGVQSWTGLRPQTADGFFFFSFWDKLPNGPKSLWNVLTVLEEPALGRWQVSECFFSTWIKTTFKVSCDCRLLLFGGELLSLWDLRETRVVEGMNVTQGQAEIR